MIPLRCVLAKVAPTKVAAAKVAAAKVRVTATVLFLLGMSIQSSWAGVHAPLNGRGDFGFVADLPVFPTQGGLSRVDAAVMVHHPQLRFSRHGNGQWQSRVEMSLKLARKGFVAVDTSQVFILRARDQADVIAPARFELLEISSAVPPGRWAATVRLHELGLGENDRGRAAVATGVLEVERWEGGARLSDPEFRLHDEGTSLPNPERLFGVPQDTLEAYLEIENADIGHDHAVDIEILDPIYGGMDHQVLQLHADREHVAHLYRLPLGQFPEGTYVMRITPTWHEDQAVEAEFSVSWRMDRVVQASRDALMEAALVLPSAEFKRFDRLSRPAQAEMMQDFWDRRDPTPGTERNELYDQFMERVRYAKQFYGEFGTPGPLSDRGRIYVRYGAPAEVSVEVIPSNGEDLEEAITEVHDTHSIELEGVVAREFENKSSVLQNTVLRRLDLAQRARETSAARDDRIRMTNQIGQEGSFELWIYRLDGDPLFPDEGTWAENVDLRFLFVDRLGTGVFQLDFSNQSNRY